MDFGLAKSTQWAGAISLTPLGYIVGSPGYMSPEQANSVRNVDRRTDVYSLGVMLYMALTGRKPFEGRTAMEILLKMDQDPVRRPTEIMRAGLNPILYQDLESVCMKALQRYPRDRHATAKRFSDALKGAMESARQAGPRAAPRAARPAPGPERVTRTPERPRTPTSASQSRRRVVSRTSIPAGCARPRRHRR